MYVCVCTLLYMYIVYSFIYSVCVYTKQNLKNKQTSASLILNFKGEIIEQLAKSDLCKLMNIFIRFTFWDKFKVI